VSAPIIDASASPASTPAATKRTGVSFISVS
jgi:hypothetical protein